MIALPVLGLAALLAAAAPTRALNGVNGTLVSLEGESKGKRPTKLMVHADGQFQTFDLTEKAAVERESRFEGARASTRTRIDRSDLTPGEYVRLEMDTKGRVTRARAVVLLERAKVRSAAGATVVLEDGTTLSIGSVLRFVASDGKPQAAAALTPGESVVLFRHPETRNIYRFGPDTRARKSPGAPKR